jgi:hypothetical protein
VTIPVASLYCGEELVHSRSAALTEALPWDLQQRVLQQMLRLSSTAREVVSVVAVHGPGAPRNLLVAAVGQPEQAVYDALDEACHARLLTQHRPATYDVTYEVIREAVVATLGAARRSAVHRRSAQWLEEVGTRV